MAASRDRYENNPRGPAVRPAAKPVFVSLVIPVFNEMETLTPLCERSRGALQSAGFTWEIVFVDDGSTDGSPGLLRAFCGSDPRIRAVFLDGNFGQHAALSAGLEQVRGEVAVIMDGDLQLDPEDIPRLVHKLGEGYDLVGGWRRERMDSSLKRKLPSTVLNALLGLATGVRMRDFNCGFKALSGDLVARINGQGDKRRYLVPLLVGLSGNITEIPVSHHPRPAGRSKYTLSRSLALVLRFVALTAAGLPRHPARAPGRTASVLEKVGSAVLGRPAGDPGSPLFAVREIVERAVAADPGAV